MFGALAVKMNIKQLTNPSSTVIDLAEAKLHLRVTGTEEDLLIANDIKAATNMIEKYTGQLLQSRTFCAYLDDLIAYDCVKIWGNYPITEITSVKYLNTSGDETTLDSSTYSVDIADNPARILFTSIPSSKTNSLNNWRIYFTAGFTSKDDIDSELLAWVKIFTGFFFSSRQVEYTGVSVSEMAIKYERQLDKYRKDFLV